MCYIDGQKNKYSVLNECNRMLKYNIFKRLNTTEQSKSALKPSNSWNATYGRSDDLREIAIRLFMLGSPRNTNVWRECRNITQLIGEGDKGT
jgi:hypothetical protein